jgi:hypothetical protein
MQQQEITRRVEFLFESAAGRGLSMDNTPQYDQAEITMVTPVVAAPAGTSLHRIVGRYRSCVCAAHGQCEVTARGGDFERRLG